MNDILYVIFGGNPLNAFDGVSAGWVVFYIAMMTLMMLIIHLDVRNADKWMK